MRYGIALSLLFLSSPVRPQFVQGPTQFPGIVGMTNYWPMDERGGTTTKDVIAGNTGTFNATPVWDSGKVDGGVSFQSADSDYIGLASIPIGNTTVFSISVWFKDSGTKDNVCYGEASTSGGNPLLLVGNNQNLAGDISAEIRDDALADGLIAVNGTYNDGVWHNAIFVQSATNSRVLYIDGVNKGTNTTTVGTKTMNNARIGSLGRLTGGFSDVKCDQIQLYVGTAITADQAAGIYQTGH